MNKKLFLVFLVLIIMIPSAFSQVRLDLGLMVPFRVGVVTDALDSSGGSEDYGAIMDYVFLVPEVGINYQFDLGPLKLGAGLRGYSLILETILWPEIYAEMEFSKLVLNANIGGLGLVYFGLLSGVQGAAFVIPDVSVGFKLGDSFRLTAGVMGLMSSDLDTSTVPYIIYFAGRFRFLFD